MQLRKLRRREVKWLKVLKRSLGSVWRMFRKEAIAEAEGQVRFLKYAVVTVARTRITDVRCTDLGYYPVGITNRTCRWIV